MPKQTKDQKRKVKLEKRRKAGERQFQQQTEMLIRMLTELCAPLLPEYTDDSKGPDLTGRAILYRLGQIAWDMEISQDLSFNDYAGKLGSLDDASREMIQKDVARLRERKRLLFPKTALGIQNVSVVLRNGVPVLKLSPQVFAHVSMEPTPEICLADEFMAELEKSASPEEAEAMRKYHKADYRYLGVRVPVIAKVAKEFAASHPEADILALCDGLWALQCHEAYVAVGKLLEQKTIKDMDAVWKRLDRYKENFQAWAMADSLIHAAARVLKERPGYLNVMEKEWLIHRNMWVRRACLTFTLHRLKEGGNPLPSMDWAEKLVKEQEWFIQKAVAWHVRELSKQFPVAAQKFIEKFRGDMKPFALREAGKYLS